MVKDKTGKSSVEMNALAKIMLTKDKMIENCLGCASYYYYYYYYCGIPLISRSYYSCYLFVLVLFVVIVIVYHQICVSETWDVAKNKWPNKQN